MALQAEEDELKVASHCIDKRTGTGSFYTPLDVAVFLCEKMLADHGVKDKATAELFISHYAVVEPSAGAGIFFFVLLHLLHTRGVDPSFIQLNARLIGVDINFSGLRYLKRNLRSIGIDILAIKSDFRDVDLSGIDRKIVYLGNPPYVKSDAKSSFDNLFADFISRSIDHRDGECSVYYIVPLSICFSRSYGKLRESILRKRYRVTLFNFDNIPDCLFYFGKPGAKNSNRANSQRCTILCLIPDRERHVFSSRLISWRTSERVKVLGSPPRVHDISNTLSIGQFLRPYSQAALEYIASSESQKLEAWLAPTGNETLFLASVARNYIGIRAHESAGSIEYRFRNKTTLLRAVAVLNSREFFEYWRTVGDGFHVTRGVVTSFPLNKVLLTKIDENLQEVAKVWRHRARFAKTKKMAGKDVVSYDLSVPIQNILGKSG